MAQTVLNLPRTTLTMDEGRIVSWLVKPGDVVEKGAPVAEMETDKAVIELEAPVSGRVAELFVEADEVVPLGAPLAVFVDHGEEYSGLDSDAGTEDNGDSEEEPTVEPGPVVREEAVPGRRVGPVRASPAARRLARRMGVDLAQVPGTGPAGRVLRRDIEEHRTAPTVPTVAASPASPAPGTTAALSSMRRAIAKSMTASWLTTPQFSLTRHVDMSAVLGLRAELVQHFESRGARISITDFIVQAVSAALLEHPLLNAGYDEAVGAYVHHDHVGMGLAVAVGDDGLVVPVVSSSDEKSLTELAQERSRVTQLALSGRGRADLFDGGTFTISNLGTVDVDQFRAIVMPGQSAILALGAVKDRVVAIDGHPEVRPMMSMTVALDHRVVDGMEAAKFMRGVVNRLESASGWTLY